MNKNNYFLLKDVNMKTNVFISSYLMTIISNENFILNQTSM